MPTPSTACTDHDGPAGFPSPSLAVLRQAAAEPEGDLPVALNGVAVCEQVRPRRLVVVGGDDRPTSMPCTAFQVVYPERTIMIDSGLDRETHECFARDVYTWTEPEPFFEDRYREVMAALDAAELVLLTHYHRDHVGGMITSPSFAELASKAIVSRRTARFLLDAPHRPNLRIGPDIFDRLRKVDYSGLHAPAPGLVLIEAPGHTPDSQMVYIRIASGQEFVNCVDSAWHMDNIRLLRGKDAPWVREDEAAIEAELRWLREVAAEATVEVFASHDGERLVQLQERGLVGRDLLVPAPAAG
jgi:glyoxylase-like metal-dependent hydrolase (beta-lactamase superfamily II)